MKRIGLTGGIGSGKSTVAKILHRHGIPFLDADQLARALRSPGGLAEKPIQNRFGTTDPKTLREIISRDSTAKADLEKILHPLIHQESMKVLAELEKQHPTAPFVLYEATLLIEAERAKDFNAVIFVTAPEKERIDRIVQRDQCSSEQALKMIRAQLADEAKLALAARSGAIPVEIIPIQNHGTHEELEKKVVKILDRLK